MRHNADTWNSIFHRKQPLPFQLDSPSTLLTGVSHHSFLLLWIFITFSFLLFYVFYPVFLSLFLVLPPFKVGFDLSARRNSPLGFSLWAMR